MNTENPFAPPGAVVADVPSGYQPVRLWPPSGRIGRLRYVAYSVGFGILTSIVGLLLGVIAGLAGSSGTASMITLALTMLLAVGSAVLLAILRSHDMDLSGWTGLLALIPLVNLWWVFKGGTRGVNRFGAPPPPNGLMVKIIALFFPVVGLIGILAAIALPAYQQYSERAGAAQPR